MSEKDPIIGYLGFSLHELEAQKAGWLQSRYYSDDDSDFVKDFLSFNEVNEICPFEVGINRKKERSEFKRRLSQLILDLELKSLLNKRFTNLSNGEMRRVLLAREILKKPDKLILDSPLAGLDAENRERFRVIFNKLIAEKTIELEFRGEIDEGEENKAIEIEFPDNSISDKKKIIEMKSILIRFGKRKLFDKFNWTIREGERWVLKGKNGAGKTTLMALITGDSPLAYSQDITVFGQKREIGCELSRIRKKIGMVSPEMQAYLGLSINELLDRAFTDKTELLILDEPCMNCSPKETKAILKRIDAFLSSRPKVTAICIAHRADHVPSTFDRLLEL